MNNLSLLIYFASVVGSVGHMLAVALIILMLATVALAITTAIAFGDNHSDDFKALSVKFLKRCVTSVVIIALVLSFLPDRKTVLMIAASEMGQKLILNPSVQQVVDPSIELLTTWMKNETAEIKKKMEGAK